MAFDERLAERIRRVLHGRAGVSERKMFGGIAFLLDGRMFVGIAEDDLMVRVGPERHEAALARPHARPMDFTGRPMKGYVFVAPAGVKSGASLSRWVREAFDHARTLPPAKPRKRRPRPARRARPRR